MKRKRNTMKRKRNTMKRKRNTKLRFTKRMGGASHPTSNLPHTQSGLEEGDPVIYNNKEYILNEDLVMGGMVWLKSKNVGERPIRVDTYDGSDGGTVRPAL